MVMSNLLNHIVRSKHNLQIKYNIFSHVKVEQIEFNERPETFCVVMKRGSIHITDCMLPFPNVLKTPTADMWASVLNQFRGHKEYIINDFFLNAYNVKQITKDQVIQKLIRH